MARIYVLIACCCLVARAADQERGNATSPTAPAVLLGQGDVLVAAQWGDTQPQSTAENVMLIGVQPAPPLPEAVVIRPTVIEPLPPEPMQPASSPKAIPAAKASSGAAKPAGLKWIEPPLPEKLIRPDTEMKVTLPAKNRVDSTATDESDGLRNPWGIRVAPASTITDYTLNLQSVIIGPKPVVIINGQSSSRGARVGFFTVAEIRRNDVVMEYDGTAFLVPAGKNIVVRIPKN